METTIHYSQQTPWADFYLEGCLAAFCVFGPEVFEEAGDFNIISSRKVFQNVRGVLRRELEFLEQVSSEMKFKGS